jgi:hypothetical protein
VLATRGADGGAVTDGNSEPSDVGVAGEGEAVGSHPNATTAAMRRAVRTDSMVGDRLRLRVRDSARKYYRTRYVRSAPTQPSCDYRSADFSRPAGR